MRSGFQGLGGAQQAEVRLLGALDTVLKIVLFIFEASGELLMILNRKGTRSDSHFRKMLQVAERPDWDRMASDRLFGRLAMIHSRGVKNPICFPCAVNQPCLSFLQPFLPFPGVYTCSAQGVWMNEVLGKSQPTCLPGTSPSSSLPQGLP